MSERALTAGEIALAQRLYKDSINYTTVKVHNEKYLPIQPDESGMTPNGEIYISGSRIYKDDYAALFSGAGPFPEQSRLCPARHGV
jgi:type VI secretion system secreted protein VgrG